MRLATTPILVHPGALAEVYLSFGSWLDFAAREDLGLALAQPPHEALDRIITAD